MLEIVANLPSAENFKQRKNRGDRYQWLDSDSDNLTILSNDSNPWKSPQKILIRLQQGKLRSGLTYPKKLDLLCLEENNQISANIIRETWIGNFVHSCEPTLLFAAWPIDKEAGKTGRKWLMLSVIQTSN